MLGFIAAWVTKQTNHSAALCRFVLGLYHKEKKVLRIVPLLHGTPVRLVPRAAGLSYLPTSHKADEQREKDADVEWRRREAKR